MRPSRESLLATVVVTISVASLAYHVVTAPPAAPDDIGRVMAAYVEAAAVLGTAEHVGFVAPDPSRTDAGAAKFIAQNAFAPRSFERNLETATHVVSMPDAPATLDADPRLAAFELIDVTPDDVRIYRRRP